MLTELGFGLDLENCAASGATADLIYVSPKSGGAVSRGRPASPTGTGCCGCRPSCAKGRVGRTAGRTRTCRTVFALTGLFLLRHVLEPRGGRAIPMRGTVLSTR